MCVIDGAGPLAAYGKYECANRPNAIWHSLQSYGRLLLKALPTELTCGLNLHRTAGRRKDPTTDGFMISGPPVIISGSGPGLRPYGKLSIRPTRTPPGYRSAWRPYDRKAAIVLANDIWQLWVAGQRSASSIANSSCAALRVLSHTLNPGGLRQRSVEQEFPARRGPGGFVGARQRVEVGGRRLFVVDPLAQQRAAVD